MIAKWLGIRIFDVEVSSACNLHCRFCPREELPETGLMSDETFQCLLDRIPLRSTDNLAFVGMGEPTLNPRLPDFIRRAKARHPGTITWVTSNGTRLTEEVVRRLTDAGLDILDVSFNGLDRAAYEEQMRGARYEESLANVERAARLIRDGRSRMTLQINYVTNRETEGREEAIEGFWRRRGIRRFRRQPVHDRAGLADVGDWVAGRERGLRAGSCALFEVTTFITWRGDALYCCHDMRRAHRIGNITRDSWATIEQRKAEIRRTRQWPAMCARCTDPSRHDIRKQIDGKIREEACRRAQRGLEAVKAASARLFWNWKEPATRVECR